MPVSKPQLRFANRSLASLDSGRMLVTKVTYNSSRMLMSALLFVLVWLVDFISWLVA